MPNEPARAQQDVPYAIHVANESCHWYKAAAMRSRRNYRTVETAVLLVSAAILTATSHRSRQHDHPAILGSVVVVGLRPNPARLERSGQVFVWGSRVVRGGVEPPTSRFSDRREAVRSSSHQCVSAGQQHFVFAPVRPGPSQSVPVAAVVAANRRVATDAGASATAH
jgi:hypothetical protein